MPTTFKVPFLFKI
ncbi:hypothetical protein Patl1_23439 [Pistacia atlantica]|uniref:Uncharacterized protein n=1 Tax=Pistacia atlantica TaxID=434234 RepID=A0ACC0ZZX3_9ROSI|nr:hypothetical protein Patl1_23439 [Pistacia atlantica]